MAILPYWPERASRAHSLIALAALWAWASFAMGLIGVATQSWADVLYYEPQDGEDTEEGGPTWPAELETLGES